MWRAGPGDGGLLPEIAGKLSRAFDAYLSPKTAPAFMSGEEREARDGVKDPRSFDERRHDILGGIIDTVARSGDTPTIGGAAPIVLVSVRRGDLDAGRGAGFMDGVASPLSMRAVEQFVCTGGTQTVTLDRSERITGLGSPQRCFTPSQRRAITLRDGGCVIPGCLIPAGWCEIRHVRPAAAGGDTHTDNGVLACWFHT